MRLFLSFSALAALGLAASLPSAAQTPITSFAVYGATGVQANVGMATGIIGSGADLSLGSFATVPGLFCGGTLTTSGVETINGPVVVNGAGNFGQSLTVNGSLDVGGDAAFFNGPTIAGNVTTGGSLTYGVAGTITGTIRTGKDFTQGGLSTVNGPVFAGRNADVESTVNGSVTYGAGLTVGPFGTISGTRMQAPVVRDARPFYPGHSAAGGLFSYRRRANY